MKKTISVLSYACELGSTYGGSSEGPGVLQQSSFQVLAQNELQWQPAISSQSQHTKMEAADEVARCCTELAEQSAECVRQGQQFLALGGDHSIAMGTWSGVAAASERPLGLIWVDAHMDSHTPETSDTQNIHGMPVASLMGHGDARFTQILSSETKLAPENIVFIGIRSFESGEQQLLERLGAKIVYIEEVKEKGIDIVMQEAIDYLKPKQLQLGISIDLDGIDPADAPGVSLPVDNGIEQAALLQACELLREQVNLCGVEIAEFTPRNDVNRITEKLVFDIVARLF